MIADHAMHNVATLKLPIAPCREAVMSVAASSLLGLRVMALGGGVPLEDRAEGGETVTELI